MVNAGDTYRRGSGAHLWIVVSDPKTNPDEIVVVNLTTHRPWQDHTCIIQAGEHPFVRHTTVVYYAEAKITTAKDLSDAFAHGLIQFQEPVSPELLQRVIDGCGVTRRMPIGVKQVLKTQGLIQE